MIKSFWPHEWPFEEIVDQLPVSGKLIEIGAYLGKSTIAWADEFKKANKDWNIHTIDAFKGIDGKYLDMEDDFQKSLVISEEEHLPTFLSNIEGRDNITWEKLIWTPDYKTKEWYDVLFYDGLHSYERVKEVLEYWVDKVECLVVDDYDFEGTRQAVDELYASMRDAKEFEHICIEGKEIAVIWRIPLP